jgi:hypothetical protein
LAASFVLASVLRLAPPFPRSLISLFPDWLQEVIGIKEVGLVEYRFQFDGFEVRHVRAPGQIDVDMDSLFGTSSS